MGTSNYNKSIHPLTLFASFIAVLIGIGGLFGTVEALDSRYVTSSELQSLAIEIFYREFFDTERELDQAIAAGDIDRADELTFRLERLLAKICELEPQFPRCPNVGP